MIKWKIGFIGLGHMGHPMARRLKSGGMDLHVYNRTKERTGHFAEAGVPVHNTPGELAGSVDIVIIMVSDPEALDDVIRAIRPHLKQDQVIINMSTVSLEATRKACEAVEAMGAQFVDAPVSGTVKPAEEGKLAIFASGSSDVVDKVEPVLSQMGRTFRCGPTGQGTALKLAINLLLGSMMGAFSEALVLAQKLGLDLDLVLDAVGAGALNAPLYTAKGAMIRENNFKTAFSVDLLLKDLRLALGEAESRNVSLPVTEATKNLFEAASAKDLGAYDMSALYRYVAEKSGLR